MPNIPPGMMPYRNFEMDRVMTEHLRLNTAGAGLVSSVPHRVKAPPAKVDLSKYLHYIRFQTGGGCWSYALLAAWDIMNEMVCPYSPNLSMVLPLWTFRNHLEWEKGFQLAQGDLLPGLLLPDGRLILNCPETNVNDQLHVIFGCTTEGTELTHHQWTNSWSQEGINEASNYRLNHRHIPIDPLTSSELADWLAAGYPVLASIPGHFVTIVGYDSDKRRFKYVNSYGDRWGQGGFNYYSYDQIDAHDPVASAERIEIIPPRPVPVVRLSLKHSENRLNVGLWLSAGGSPLPKRRIWPHLQPNEAE